MPKQLKKGFLFHHGNSKSYVFVNVEKKLIIMSKPGYFREAIWNSYSQVLGGNKSEIFYNYFQGQLNVFFAELNFPKIYQGSYVSLHLFEAMSYYYYRRQLYTILFSFLPFWYDFNYFLIYETTILEKWSVR